MADRLMTVIRQRGDLTYIKLSGILDADNPLVEWERGIAGGLIVIDLADLERVTAEGWDAWEAFVEALDRRSALPLLIDVAPAMIAHLGDHTEISKRIAVKSFFAPYMCTSCGHEQRCLLDADEMTDPPGAPRRLCESCGTPLRFDDDEMRYFGFLKYLARPIGATRLSQLYREAKALERATNL